MFDPAANRTNSLRRLPFFGLALALAVATAGVMAASAGAIGASPAGSGVKADRLPSQELRECNRDCNAGFGVLTQIIHDPAESRTTATRGHSNG